MKLNNLAIIFFILGVVIIGGCAKEKPLSQSTEETEKGDQEISEEEIERFQGQFEETLEKSENSAGGIEGVVEIEMIAKQWEFEPSTIIANKGDNVILKIKSNDVTHGFNLPAFNINKNLPPGEIVVVEFLADKVGEFDFFCSVPCGAGHSNMNGKLVVE